MVILLVFGLIGFVEVYNNNSVKFKESYGFLFLMDHYSTINIISNKQDMVEVDITAVHAK